MSAGVTCQGQLRGRPEHVRRVTEPMGVLQLALDRTDTCVGLWLVGCRQPCLQHLTGLVRVAAAALDRTDACGGVLQAAFQQRLGVEVPLEACAGGVLPALDLNSDGKVRPGALGVMASEGPVVGGDDMG
jgi:hypothetical protein